MAERLGDFEIARLNKRHDRSAFTSGEPELDDFLRQYARQNDEKDISRTYVATRPGSKVVAGYYTVRSGAVEFDDVPEEERRRLPRYPVPVVHLARLAVNQGERGHRLGELLLMHGVEKAMTISEQLGIMAVEVIAKNDRARTFYTRYGFLPLVDDELHLYLSMKAIQRAFGARSVP